MKSTVETLSPTRVKLSVEVGFDELRPAMDAAYARIGRQVKVQGFRPGKVPPAILDQRVGRAAILDEALNDAIPRFYAAAVEESKLAPVSRPEVELGSFSDGGPLVFTATVDVRPDVELPDYEGLPVSVDDVVVSDEEVDAQLDGLRDRFATLHAVDREVADGDYVVLDISATVDGEPVPGSEATGLSYQVGHDNLVPGLDEAIRGSRAGESATFDAEVRFGELAGRTASFTATVTAVKEKEVPALDDEFAQTASEFDTIDELRGDVRERLLRLRRIDQAMQARDRALEVLLARTDVPLPESMVDAEAGFRRERLEQQLGEAGISLEAFLASNGKSAEEIDTELRSAASEAVKAQLVLDAVAAKEELQVSQMEMADQLYRRAQRAGMAPEEYARLVQEEGQVGALVGDVLRGKALALVLEHATITDASGNPVDLEALRDDASAAE